MGKVTKRDSESLNRLVLDCSMYNFSEEESLKYIKARFGKAISGRTYRRYKANLENGNISQEWMSHFTRTGFVTTHHQIFEGARYLLESSMHRLYEEEKSGKFKNELFILKLKQEIREELKVLSEISLGTPVLEGIKQRIATLEKRIKQKEAELRSKVLVNYNVPSSNYNSSQSDTPRVNVLK